MQRSAPGRQGAHVYLYTASSTKVVFIIQVAASLKRQANGCNANEMFVFKVEKVANSL